MNKFLDKIGLTYFWEKLKAYIEVLDAKNVKSVNSVRPDTGGNVVIEAIDINFDDSQSGLTKINVQEAIDQLDEEMRYNAIHVFDATLQSAPPNLPRGYNWHVDMIGDMQEEHSYSRYFYLSAADAKQDERGAPLRDRAVARWAIEGAPGVSATGKRVFFEFLENGLVTNTVNLTNADGTIRIPSYRPIPIGDIWFFGKNQADDFPTDDNVRSIIDINVWTLTVMLGNTFDLETIDKQIVGAINELNQKSAEVEVIEAFSVQEALEVSQQNPKAFVFIART